MSDAFLSAGTFAERDRLDWCGCAAFFFASCCMIASSGFGGVLLVVVLVLAAMSYAMAALFWNRLATKNLCLARDLLVSSRSRWAELPVELPEY